MATLIYFPTWYPFPYGSPFRDGMKGTYLLYLSFDLYKRDFFQQYPPPFKETHRQTIAKPSISQAPNFGVSETLTLFFEETGSTKLQRIFFTVGCWLLSSSWKKNGWIRWAIHRSVAGSFGFAFLWQSATFWANVWVGRFWCYNLNPCAYGWRCWISWEVWCMWYIYFVDYNLKKYYNYWLTFWNKVQIYKFTSLQVTRYKFQVCKLHTCTSIVFSLA